MMTTWFDTIIAYSFNIVYRPGVLNVCRMRNRVSFLRNAGLIDLSKKTPIKVYGYIHMLQGKSVSRFTVAAKDRHSLMAGVHSLGHIGAITMANQIHAQDKTWPLMVKDCLEYV